MERNFHLCSSLKNLYCRTDSRFAPSQSEMSLQSNAGSKPRIIPVLVYQEVPNMSTTDRWLVVSPHKGQVIRKAFPLHDVIMMNTFNDLAQGIHVLDDIYGFDSKQTYRKTSNIRRTWEGNKIVDHSDVVGASPVGAAPTTSSFSTDHLSSMDWAKTTVRRDENHSRFGIWCSYIRDLMVLSSNGSISGHVAWCTTMI